MANVNNRWPSYLSQTLPLCCQHANRWWQEQRKSAVLFWANEFSWRFSQLCANRLENKIRKFPSCWSTKLFSPSLIWKSYFIFQSLCDFLCHVSGILMGADPCPPWQRSCSVLAAMFLKASAEKWTSCLILLFLCPIVRSYWLWSTLCLLSQRNMCVFLCVYFCVLGRIGNVMNQIVLVGPPWSESLCSVLLVDVETGFWINGKTKKAQGRLKKTV